MSQYWVISPPPDTVFAKKKLCTVYWIMQYLLLYWFAGLATYKRVCYYTNWSQYRLGEGKFLPSDIDPTLCTHLIFAFGKLVGNTVQKLEGNDYQL